MSHNLRRKFRYQIRTHKRSANGWRSWSFGLRAGLWPCMMAPFVQVAFLFWIVELWHGYPSKEMMRRDDA